MIQAAGAVVFDPAERVLVVHRPRYDDLSLPKGKLEPGEHAAVAALREVREETGAIVALDADLPSVSYRVGDNPKTVHWWRGTVIDESPWQPDQEVDAVHWLTVDAAHDELTYGADRETLTAALTATTGPALIILRHAKAVGRNNWTGSDLDRPLTTTGEHQAAALADTLASFGVQNLISSPARRCLASLEPYAQRLGTSITAVDALTEPAGRDDPAAVRRAVTEAAAQAAADGQPTVICGHRPVLPDMLGAAGIDPTALRPAEFRMRHVGSQTSQLGLDSLVNPRFTKGA